MNASSDLDTQVTTIRIALASLPETLTRFDIFVGKMDMTHPREASEEILTWLKGMNTERRYELEELHRFLRALKRATFESVMYQSLQSFDTYYAVEVLPLIINEEYTEAATSAWKEFIHNFKNAWNRHDQYESLLRLPRMSHAR